MGLEKDPQNPALKPKGKDLATAPQESSDTTGITKLSEINEPSFIESQYDSGTNIQKERCSQNEEVIKAIETANLNKSGSEGFSQTQQKIKNDGQQALVDPKESTITDTKNILSKTTTSKDMTSALETKHSESVTNITEKSKFQDPYMTELKILKTRN